MAYLQLNSRLTPNIDFTRRDEITFFLMDTIKCRISMEIPQNMIIFNHQYYNRICFDKHERNENTLNHRRVRQEQIEPDKMRLKDLRTGMGFNPGFAIRTLYHAHPSRDILVQFIKKRIREITKEEINAFVPDQEDQKTNTEYFMSLIRTMDISGQENNNVYTRHIRNSQRSMVSNSASPSNLKLPSEISQQSTSSASRHPAFDIRRYPPPLRDSAINLDADSNTSDSDNSDDSDDSDSLFACSTNCFNISNVNLSEGESDDSVQPIMTYTAPSNLLPNCTSTPPPPLNAFIITGQPLHEPLEIPTTIEMIQESGDNNPPPLPASNNSGIASLSRSITTTTTTPAFTPTQLPTVTQLSQDANISSVGDDVTNTVRKKLLPPLPSFLHHPGSGMCSSVLALAKADGFNNTLCHGKRTPWFASKNDSFFANDGILCRFRFTQVLQVRRKFKEAENAAKLLFEGNTHQDDPSGEQDEGNLPIYARAFFEYFIFGRKDIKSKYSKSKSDEEC